MLYCGQNVTKLFAFVAHLQLILVVMNLSRGTLDNLFNFGKISLPLS